MLLKKILLTLIVPLVFCSVSGQDNKPLSLDDCIKLGLERNKTLKISKSKVTAADEKLSEVNAGMLPSLRLTGSYSRLSEVEKFTFPGSSRDTAGLDLFPVILNNYQFKLTLQQPLFAGMRLSSNSDIMENNYLATREDRKRDEAQLILDIENAYWSHFNALQLVKTVNENISQVEGHLKDVENFYRQNLSTDNDVLKVKVQLSNLKLLRLDAENAVNTTRMVLNNLVGLPTMQNTIIPEIVGEEPADIPELESLINNAYQNRPELKGMEYRIKTGESGVRMANAGWFPQVNFAANYYYSNPNQRIFPSQEKFRATWDVGINFSFDIWNWLTTSHQVEQAKATLEQTRYSTELIRDGVNLEVSQGYFSLVKAKEKIQYAIENRDQAKENYRVTNEKFKAGMTLNSELVDAESALLIANINYTNAIVEYKIAKAKLEKAVGRN
ncbi:MAG: TolC family protein [Bacteroidetes bacterium]|nr:MAG: TolC family protein [Bacteroidota bacterium]